MSVKHICHIINRWIDFGAGYISIDATFSFMQVYIPWAGDGLGERTLSRVLCRFLTRAIYNHSRKNYDMFTYSK